MSFEAASESEMRSLSVDESDAGVRLDTFLAEHVAAWSRARLQRLIEEHDVLVNGKPSKSSYKLRAGDQLEIELAPPPSTDFVPENIPLDVVFEDDELVVINKPAGLVVHPAAGAPSGTLANALAFHFQQLPTRGGKIRPGIVHRLDKDTSGLMVVAKTEAAHEILSDQFRARAVFKSYMALVHGVMKNPSGRIEQPLARDPRNRTRMAVVAGGRPALSLYKVRRQFSAFTLVDVELKTGRTHQIRVHLSWLNHPVVADELYGSGRDNTVRSSLIRARIKKLKRQFLHAEKLEFAHPRSGERLTFTSALPVELTEFLDVLESADEKEPH